MPIEGPSQLHLSFSLHSKVWLLYFIAVEHVETKEMTVKLPKQAYVQKRNLQ